MKLKLREEFLVFTWLTLACKNNCVGFINAGRGGSFGPENDKKWKKKLFENLFTGKWRHQTDELENAA